MDYFPLRIRKGPGGGASRLTPDDVRTIRRMADEHPEWSAPMIADQFPGMGVETIRRVIRRDSHRNIPDAPRSIPQTTMDQQMDLLKQAEAMRRLEEDAKRFPQADRLLDEMDQPPTEVAPKNPLDETEDKDD